MKSQTLSRCTLILCCLLVSDGEQRIRQESPRSPQAEPGAQPASSGASAPNDAGHGSDDPIANGNRAAQAGLAVRIELDGTDDTRTLNFEEPLRLVLVNNYEQAVGIWNPERENGYRQFLFHFKNLRSGETYVARKRLIDDKEFWKSLE